MIAGLLIQVRLAIMCNNKELFVEWRTMKVQDVLLGDGHKLEATAVGTVSIDMLQRQKSVVYMMFYMYLDSPVTC